VEGRRSEGQLNEVPRLKKKFQVADIVLQNVTLVLVSRNSESWKRTRLTVCGRSGRINGLSLPRTVLHFSCKKLLE